MLPIKISKTNFYQYSRTQSYAYFKHHLKLIEEPTPELDPVKLAEFMEVEKLAMKAAELIFGPNIKYVDGEKNFDQYEIIVDDNLQFRADGFQINDDHTFNLFEVKATTSNSFFEQASFKYKSEDQTVIESLIQKTSNEYNVYKMNQPNYSNELAQKSALKKYQNFLNRDNDKVGKYIWDIAFQYFVIQKHLKEQKKYNLQTVFQSGKYYLVILNSEYVYDGKKENGKNVYDLKKLFIFLDVTTLCQDAYQQIEQEYKLVVESFKLVEDPKDYYNARCFKGDKTKANFFPYFNHCFGQYFNSINSFMHISGVNLRADKKMELLVANNFNSTITNEIISMAKTPNLQLYLECHKNAKVHKNISNIKKFVNDLVYPIYHLDFESYNQPLPRFIGETPYTQSVFQYSLHIENQPGICDEENNHHDYLATDHSDQRYQLYEHLVNQFDFSQNFTVIVWNEAFEKKRLEEAAELFPDLADKLLKIRDAVIDLMYAVKGNKNIFGTTMPNYYNPKQKGSFSIKKVLPIFAPNINYDQLMQVKNGVDAMAAYARLEQLDSNQKGELLENMRNYCKLDTYAMVEILRGLRQLITT